MVILWMATEGSFWAAWISCMEGQIKMKRDLMDILACPVHKTDLELTVKEEDGQDVLEGDLYCGECAFHYPIEGGIPNLLPPEMHEKSA